MRAHQPSVDDLIVIFRHTKLEHVEIQVDLLLLYSGRGPFSLGIHANKNACGQADVKSRFRSGRPIPPTLLNVSNFIIRPQHNLIPLSLSVLTRSWLGLIDIGPPQGGEFKRKKKPVASGAFNRTVGLWLLRECDAILSTGAESICYSLRWARQEQVSPH